MGQKPTPIWKRFYSRLEVGNGCWEWQGNIACNGYGEIGAPPPGKKRLSAHRLSWELHYGPIPKGLHVCHSCDVKHCVNPLHLFLGTALDNQRDMTAKGRGRTGKNGYGKVTLPMAREMVRDYNGPGSVYAIAEGHGVCPQSIRDVVSGNHWTTKPDT